MTTLDERFQKGIETRTKFGAGVLSGGSVPSAWDIAPDLQRIAGEFLFGSIWHRPALKDTQREMVTLTCLTVLKRDNQVRRHLGNALNLGLTPVEIWISEAQERMVLSVPPGNVARLQELCDKHDVELCDLGEFGTEGRELILRHGETEVGRMPMALLHDGLPDRVLSLIHI